MLLLHGGRRDVREVAERLWYPLWDAGLKLGHGVRTIKEALALAASDLEVATSLLTVRLVAGSAELAEELAERSVAQWRKSGARWLSVLRQSVQDRHARAGEVAFLLEPDLKEGRGGLRDVHALQWAEAAGRIDVPFDRVAVTEAYDTLLDARVELHRRTGKATDRLLLQEQDAVAEALGDADADILMARLAGAARTIAWTSDEAWWRIASALQGPTGRMASRDHLVAPGVVLRDGVIELASDADVSDPVLPLRAAAAAAVAATRLSHVALDRLATGAPALGDPWPPEARQRLVELLGTGRSAIPSLEALDQRGLLVRLLPEWAEVRSRPQRNAYHRFTVDRHLCEAAAEAAAFVDRVKRADLLLIGTWLHDIGKGFPGDHTDAGVEIVGRIATRMGFDADDVAVLVDLVRLHLLLPDTATRRDLDDEATITTVADAVGDVERLHLLHALTEADSLATGPAAWGSWKAGLVEDLVARTARVLAGEPAVDGTLVTTDADDERASRVLAAARRDRSLAVEGGDGRLVLAAPDRPGLFCRVAGTLTLHALDVLSARAWASDDGFALEAFEVVPAFDREPDWSAVERDLRQALAGRLSLEARLAARARTYAGRVPQAAAPARTHVAVDNGASASATVVEVRAPDAVGTLYRITRALAELDLDIRHAKVSTLGHEVVDAFYVVDNTGAKIDDPDHAHEVEAAVLVELERLHTE